ncbi:hypothetical protein [Burkholderia ambifaria]|uniref:hypothetical protein n=1 Tax=Burkholderia ambifaria TaxID=152480 RepID=UPI000F806C1F|nr:hypothetical protein [Burkholderia ambifaria]WDR86016.1 hypothetical protein OR986_06255 [Burkholderia ambifaria]WDR98646.1 hypothetical protein OR985_11205 [Burkholderia ambifaria]
MKRGLGTALGLLAALCCSSSLAAGILKLSRTEMKLEPGKPASELWAENIGDTPLYLDVTQHLVTNPGHTPEQLVPVTEVEQPSLLVLPSRLTLSPRQRYRIAIKELATPSDTQVWRLTFRPKENIVVDAGNVADGQPTPLIISVGYGVVIYQLASARR